MSSSNVDLNWTCQSFVGNVKFCEKKPNGKYPHKETRVFYHCHGDRTYCRLCRPGFRYDVRYRKCVKSGGKVCLDLQLS